MTFIYLQINLIRIPHVNQIITNFECLSSFILCDMDRRWNEMDNSKAQALAAYLQALALMQQTNKTYVHREIAKVMEEIEKELGLKNN